ncbi:DUF7024 domain-containing protein [Lysobacter antibioticus]|uniref:DUF7024 domain-containing protein n=1 Tax=Lysobacter antibioticus TaxID=84531 RepID=UPI0011401A69|nr:sugar translocase [Lysobacter antibioticus]
MLPNLNYPYIYSGDGLSHSWMIQRVMEGWLSDNPRNGYPFGSNFLDYPNSDAANLALLKLLGAITGSYQSAFNLYFLLGFPATFIAAFCVLRTLGLSRNLAASASLAFAFLPFHFLRLPHLFYTWYFVVPLFFYVGLRIFFAEPSGNLKTLGPCKLISICASLILLACFGVYYAFFGIIVLSIAGAAAGIRNRTATVALPAVGAIALIVIGTMLNLAPSLANRAANGPNPEVAARSPVESEVYGLKMMQLILPRADHRVPRLAAIGNTYRASFPLVNENSTATLGALGTVGFLLAGAILLIRLSGGSTDQRLAFLTLLALVLFAFGTIGGLGTLFSSTISASIRGWNRISVFIAFASISLCFLAIQILTARLVPTSKRRLTLGCCGLALGSLGLYDQSTPVCRPCNVQVEQAFDQDREFIAKIERQLPPGSAIYQLPYMPFPESSPVHQLVSYELAIGFLHSKALNWSFGGMKGRKGDLFYRTLASQPLATQLQVVERMGFAGIYIDRRGFADHADTLLAQLTARYGSKAALSRTDGEIIFFKFGPTKHDAAQPADDSNSSPIPAAAGESTRAPQRLAFKEGVDFSKDGWPYFVKDATGLSGREQWGRWSDANIAPSVKLELISPLPKKFSLILTARAFQPENDKVVVKIGTQSYALRIGGDGKEVRLPVDLVGESTNAIEFIPAAPISPQRLGVSADVRKLGIGMIRLRIEYD